MHEGQLVTAYLHTLSFRKTFHEVGLIPSSMQEIRLLMLLPRSPRHFYNILSLALQIAVINNNVLSLFLMVT